MFIARLHRILGSQGGEERNCMSDSNISDSKTQTRCLAHCSNSVVISRDETCERVLNYDKAMSDPLGGGARGGLYTDGFLMSWIASFDAVSFYILVLKEIFINGSYFFNKKMEKQL